MINTERVALCSDGLSYPPSEQAQSSRSSRTPTAPDVPELAASQSEATLERRSSNFLTNIYNNWCSKPQKERENSSDADGAHELEEQCRALREQVEALKTSEEKARVEIERLKAEKQTTERARLMGKCTEKTSSLEREDAEIQNLKQRHNDAVKKFEARVNALTHEREDYDSELRETQDKCRALEEQVRMFQTSGQPQDDIRADHAELTRKVWEQSRLIDEANTHIHSLMQKHQYTVTDYESRIDKLLLDGGSDSPELREAQARSRALQEKVQRLKASEKQAQDEIQRLKEDHARLMDSLTEKSEYIDGVDGYIQNLLEEHRDLVTKYNDLLVERGKHRSQLKQLRTQADARASTKLKADIISLDPFDNKLDQVSEAAVKSGVESLNDSIDNFTMALVDEAEEFAKQNSHSVIPSAVAVHEITKPLHLALAEHSRTEEKRGFLLDANLHHGLVSELDTLFFSGDVVSRALDLGGVLALALPELTKREPWTVAQRWRALTAAAIGTGVLQSSATIWTESITNVSEAIISLLAFAYRQPLGTFEPLLPSVQNRLETLYNEANEISIVARRDILSSRMTVVVAPTGAQGVEDYLPYNTDSVTSVWPDMGPSDGDGIIGLYKFGLDKTGEDGRLTCLIKPEVVTTALLREMAKN
ncbi:hypothetical protein MSAN_01170200 [Mycena sanguinolenta]|uniref:Uncharacterized protein n=1 Tax=Mycena sanguinolenta TaxID=230812 RepID=A0A8H7D406_9AGAR|nr:hypothetical protein MSAN_01170200 [Mycena sanguinolenta]